MTDALDWTYFIQRIAYMITLSTSIISPQSSTMRCDRLIKIWHALCPRSVAMQIEWYLDNKLTAYLLNTVARKAENCVRTDALSVITGNHWSVYCIIRLSIMSTNIWFGQLVNVQVWMHLQRCTNTDGTDEWADWKSELQLQGDRWTSWKTLNRYSAIYRNSIV